MSVLVVGAGALGTLFAAEAARRLGEVSLLVRRPIININDNKRIRNGMYSIQVRVDPSILLKSSNHSKDRASFRVDDAVRVLTLGDLAASSSPFFDVILLACKQFDLRQCSEALQANKIESRVCVTLANGLGCAEEVRSGGYSLTKEVLTAVTYAGARRQQAVESSSPTLLQVDRTGFAETLMTEPRDEVASRVLQRAIPQLRFVSQDDLDKTIWKKLLANCCINPLTAILNVPNGMIPTLAPRLVESLCDEFMRVTPVPLDFSKDGCASAVEFVSKVCSNTAPNTSSMLADCLNKRRTEIEAMNGALLRRSGALSDENLVTHRIVYDLVKALERKNGID